MNISLTTEKEPSCLDAYKHPQNNEKLYLTFKNYWIEIWDDRFPAIFKLFKFFLNSLNFQKASNHHVFNYSLKYSCSLL